VTVTLSCTPFYSKSKIKEKEKKRKINNDLAVLPSHDRKQSGERKIEMITKKEEIREEKSEVKE